MYFGIRHATLHDEKVLGNRERCQRNPAAQWYVRWYDRHQAALNAERRAMAAIDRYDGWAIPRPIVMCESGGRNLPPNSASASGYYQFTYDTWHQEERAIGVAYADKAYEAPRFAQDRLAALLWNGGRGRTNWVCAGMTGY